MSGVVVLAWVAGGALVSTSAFAVAVAFGRRARQRRDERDQRVLQMVREANFKADHLIAIHQGGGNALRTEHEQFRAAFEAQRTKRPPQPIGSVGIRTTGYPSGATSREEGPSIAWPTDAERHGAVEPRMDYSGQGGSFGGAGASSSWDSGSSSSSDSGSCSSDGGGGCD